MKLISTPNEMEIRFDSLDDLKIHVGNLCRLVEHNDGHVCGQSPHLSYCITPDPDAAGPKFKTISSDGSTHKIECVRCAWVFLVDPGIEENVIPIKTFADRSPVLKSICPKCGQVDT